MAYRPSTIALSGTLGLKQNGAGQFSLFRNYPKDDKPFLQSKQPRPDRGTGFTREEARELQKNLEQLLEQW